MGKDKFVIGDYVFAKVRGYPAWPAKIQSILDPRPATLKYEVFFFGTSETATVQAKEVFPYEEFKEKYGKPIKRKHFNEAIEQLEAAMKKKASPDDATNEPITDGDAAASEDPKETVVEVKSNKRQRESVDGEAATTEPRSKRKASTDVSKARQSESVDEKETKKVQAEPDSGRKRKRSTLVESSFEGSQSKEQTSRSGRVIKPKKFLYDEEEKEDMENKPKAKSSYSPASKENIENKDDGNDPLKKKSKLKFKTDKPEKKTVAVPLAKLGRVLWTRTKTGQLVQVQIDHEKPKFKSTKSRIEWEENYEKRLQELREKIATGEMLPDGVPEQITPSEEELSKMTSKEKTLWKRARCLERMRGQARLLNFEAHVVDINVALRTCLQKNKADLPKALELLEELINSPVEALMLKKYPQLIETVKKIQNYVGNVTGWKMSEEEEANFKKNATELRKKAKTAYEKFQSLFEPTENFTADFNKALDAFKTLTKDMTAEKILRLVVDPSSPYFQEISTIVEEDESFIKEFEEPIHKETSDKIDSTS